MIDRTRGAFIYIAALSTVVTLALVFTGCNRGNSKAAIQAAIDAHLKQRPGLTLSNMTTEIQEVKFDGDKATAEATFQSKQVPDLKVEVRYVLRREGDHWEVESSTPVSGMGTSPHSGAGAPSANEGMGQTVPAAGPAVPPLQPSH
jgi:hypothetical protein